MTVSEFGRFIERPASHSTPRSCNIGGCMKAILLAGGKGTRLRPLTIHTPKPIVPIFDRPFLHYQIDLLKQVPEIDEVDPQPQLPAAADRRGLRRRRRPGVAHPLRRRAGAARHRRRDPVTPAQGDRRDTIVVFNGDVLTQVDLGGGDRAAPRAQGQGDDRADAGRQPDAPTAWSKPTPTATSGASSRSRSADEITCDTINAGIYVLEPETLRPDPEGHAVFDRARLLPVARSNARDVRRLRLPRLLDRHRHAGEVRAGAPRHHGRPLRRRRPFARRRRPRPIVSPDGAHRGRRRSLEGPCFIDAGVQSSRPAPRIGPYTRDRPRRATSRKTRRSTARSSGPTPASARSAIVDGADRRPQLPHRPQRRSSRAASSSATRRALTDYTQHRDR